MKLSLSALLAEARPLSARARALAGSDGLVGVVVAGGVAVRLAQFLFNRSLWHDEASLAVNIVQRDFAGLLQPLDNLQMAPPAFVLLLRLMVELLGPGEQALRLLPLLGGIASLLLFVPVARALLDRETAALAILLFAVGDKLIYFSTEVKQYSTDVTAALVVTLLAIGYLQRGGAARLIALAAAGALLVWLSHAVIFVLAGVGLVLGVQAIVARQWRLVGDLALVAVLWLGSFGNSYLLSLRMLEAPDAMSSAWQYFFPGAEAGEGFWLLRARTWFFESLLGAFENPLGFPAAMAGLGLSLAIVGGVALVRAKPAQGALLLLPIGLTLLAAALGYYPFFQRLLLFLTPAILILIAWAIVITARHVRFGPQLALLLLVLLAGRSVLEAGYKLLRPVPNQELRPALVELRARVQPGDTVFVYSGALPAFDYYTTVEPLPAGDVVRNTAPKFDFAAHNAQLDALAGRPRVWVVISHNVERGGLKEADLLRYELNRRALRVEAFEETEAVVYRYDFTAPPDLRMLLR